MRRCARSTAPARRAKPFPSATKETRQRSFHSSTTSAFVPTRSPIRRGRTICSTATFRAGLTLKQAAELRRADPERVSTPRARELRRTRRRDGALSRCRCDRLRLRRQLRAQAERAGFARAFAFPGFVPAFIRPLFCRGSGPFRFAALSGDPSDIERCDEKLLELFPDDASLARWIRLARERIAFQGLPARICWLGYGDRAKAGVAFNDLVRDGVVKAPIVIGRDHLDTGSVASPYRETEAMRDGTDAIADWPILNALLNAAAGAHWVSYHHGGGVGIGYSLHAGMVVVADGSDDARERLECVLTTDPGIGVVRHADAGYEIAIETADAKGIDWRL